MPVILASAPASAVNCAPVIVKGAASVWIILVNLVPAVCKAFRLAARFAALSLTAIEATLALPETEAAFAAKTPLTVAVKFENLATKVVVY